MRGVAFVVVFCFVVCAAGTASASSELRKWQTATGAPPSKNEFAAVVAACEDRAKNDDKTSQLEGCLADYGLRRVQ